MSQETIKICQYCGTDHSRHRLGASYACGPEKYHHLRIEDWPDGTRPFDTPDQGKRETIEDNYVKTVFPGEPEKPVASTTTTNTTGLVVPVHLQKRDTLIVMLWDRRSEHDMRTISEKFKFAFPDNGVVVLDVGAEFATIKTDQQPFEDSIGVDVNAVMREVYGAGGQAT